MIDNQIQMETTYFTAVTVILILCWGVVKHLFILQHSRQVPPVGQGMLTFCELQILS